MAKIHIIGAYDEKLSPGVDCSVMPSLTKQSFKDECDINNIMAKFERTGLAEFVNEASPQYGDVSSFDFQSAMETVAKGQSMFEQMPAQYRAEFDNDPARFLAFVEKPQANVKLAVDLGILPIGADQPLAEVPPIASKPV